MNNQEIADKIFESYYIHTKDKSIQNAKNNSNMIINAQIELMFQGEGTLIIGTDRELYLEDWEEIRYLINIK